MPAPKVKELLIEFLDRPRRVIYGQQELLALCKITNTDPFKGEFWCDAFTIETVSQVLHVLLKRDDPTLTLEATAALWGPSDLRDIKDTCVQLQTGLTMNDIERITKEKLELPLSQTPHDTGPSVN